MQGDLISRSVLIEALRTEEKECEEVMTSPSFWSVFKIINEQPTAYDVEKVVEETDKVLADLNVVEVLSHFEPDKTIQMPLSNFLCAFKDEIGRLIRNGGKE